MNQDRFHGLHGVWKLFSGNVKEQWGTLIDDPFATAAGTRDLITARIQKQRGISKKEADRQLADFVNRNRNWWNLSRP